jgi:hypothetical protein
MLSARDKETKTMLQSVEGIYKKGRIELLETPDNIEESPVIITFLGTQPLQKAQSPMYFGMFGDGSQSSEQDFSLAEFQGDSDDGLDWS